MTNRVSTNSMYSITSLLLLPIIFDYLFLHLKFNEYPILVKLPFKLSATIVAGLTGEEINVSQEFSHLNQLLHVVRQWPQ